MLAVVLGQAGPETWAVPILVALIASLVAPYFLARQSARLRRAEKTIANAEPVKVEGRVAALEAEVAALRQLLTEAYAELQALKGGSTP